MPDNKAQDADAALQELGSDLVGQAMSPQLSRSGTTIRVDAEERLRQVEKTIQGRDFTCMRETVNAVEAWLGGLPGHVYANVRQPPISTLNLAHMMPFSAVWAGRKGTSISVRPAVLRPDRRLDAVPLFPSCRRRRPHPDRRPDRCWQERASGTDGAAVPSLSGSPRSSSSTLAARCGRRRSPWAATGTTWVARSRR